MKGYPSHTLFLECLNGLTFAPVRSEKGYRHTCAQELHGVFYGLDQAGINGVSGSLSWPQAPTLLSAAMVQQQLKKYPNCIDKVKRARFYSEERQNASLPPSFILFPHRSKA